MFRYPGGKSKLAPIITRKIISQFYTEPFFGGGSIGIKLLPRLEKIWINDKDLGVASFWTSVIQHPEKLKKLVRDFKPTVDHFFQFKAELMQTPISQNDVVDFGFKKLAIHQISYSGLGTKSGGPLGGLKQESRYKIDCRWSPEYICKKIDKLHSMFNKVEVFQGRCTSLDFSEVIENQNSFMYLDPPYFKKGNQLYQCGFSIADHQKLSELLKTKHNWLLSYDDSPEIRNLYSWAKIEEIDVIYNITARIENERKVSRTKPELFISH